MRPTQAQEVEMKFKGNERPVLIASGAVAVALFVILVSVLPTIDSRSINEGRQGSIRLSYQYEFSETYDLEKWGFIVVGTSPLAASVETALASLNVNRTTISVVSPDLSRMGVLLVDRDWLDGAESDVAALSSLVAKGVTVFIINGTAEDFGALMPADSMFSSLSSTSDGRDLSVRGICVSPDGGLVEIGGDAADPSQLKKAVTSAVNWTSNHGTISPANELTNVTVHYYYPGDEFKPHGRIAIQNYYREWASDPPVHVNPNDRLVHYKVQVDPGWAAYGSEYRMSRTEYKAEFGQVSSFGYSPPQIVSGQNMAALDPYMLPESMGPSPGSWTFDTELASFVPNNIEHMGRVGGTFNYDPGAYESGRSSTIEPGVTFLPGVDGASFSGHYEVTWAKPDLVSWDKHTERIEFSGAVR